MADRRVIGVLPLRGTVLFPGPPVTIAVSRAASLKTIEAAAKGDREIFAVAQRDQADEASVENLYTMGVLAKIGQIQPGVGSVQVVVTAEQRATAIDYHTNSGGQLSAIVLPVDPMPLLDPEEPASRALYREVRERARELGMMRGLPEEVLRRVIESVAEPGPFADVVATFTCSGRSSCSRRSSRSRTTSPTRSAAVSARCICASS
jgi:ATP-dependent Lon protease